MTSDSCWMINFTFVPDQVVEDHTFEAIADRFDELDWSFATGPHCDLVVTIYLNHDESAFNSMSLLHDQAKHELEEVGLAAALVKCEAMTEDRRDAEAEEPQIPELVATADIADALDISRQRVNQLMREHKAFPSPVVKTGGGFLWTLASVQRFARVWDRRSGKHGPDSDDSTATSAVVQFPIRDRKRYTGRDSDHRSERCEA